MSRKTAASHPPATNSTASTASTDTKPRIALVLQGGGALGAYQAGVYQAMHEHDLTPDWVVGTSIGAINAAIIAGNPREVRIERLRAFWESISHPDLVNLQQIPDATRQLSTWLTTMDTFARGVPGFFAPRPFNPFAVGLPVPAEEASFYSTDELRSTLASHVDFDFLNRAAGIRLTVSAVKVTCGTLVEFDSSRQTINADHVMASGALPPGFAPIRVDGELYWDGGLYSNTPLESVLSDEPRQNTLCMMVDLWHPDGPEPRTLEAVQTRQKDVTFASRSQRHIDAYLKQYELSKMARDLYQRLPANLRKASDREQLAALGVDTTIHIVRLPYAGRDWNMASKDVNFSRGSIEWRWQQGYQDALRGIELSQGSPFNSADGGVVVHELPPLDEVSRG
jgi:NTE family protein